MLPFCPFCVGFARSNLGANRDCDTNVGMKTLSFKSIATAFPFGHELRGKIVCKIQIQTFPYVDQTVNWGKFATLMYIVPYIARQVNRHVQQSKNSRTAVFGQAISGI